MAELPSKVLLGLLILGNLVTVSVEIAALGSEKWVFLQGKEAKLDGGLIKCANCSEPFAGIYYKTAANSQICQITFPDYSNFCHLFTNLHNSGVIYMTFSLFSIVFSLTISLKLLLFLLNSSRSTCSPYIFKVISAFSALFRFLGLAIWAGTTKATFASTCDMELADKTLPQVCTAWGVGLSLLSLSLFTLFSLCFITFIDLNRSILSPIREIKEAEVSISTIQVQFA